MPDCSIANDRLSGQNTRDCHNLTEPDDLHLSDTRDFRHRFVSASSTRPEDFGQIAQMQKVKLIPFAVLWPIIRLLAPLIIRLILPLILQKSRVSGGAVTLSDNDISEILDANRDTIKANYRNM